VASEPHDKPPGAAGKVVDLRKALARLAPTHRYGAVTEWRLADAPATPYSAAGGEAGLTLVLREGDAVRVIQVDSGEKHAFAEDAAAFRDAIGGIFDYCRPEVTLPPRQRRVDLSAAEVEALRAGGVEVDPAGPAALVSGLDEWLALVRDSLTTKEAARRLKVNESRIRQRLGGRARTLYGFRDGHAWLVPVFQLDGSAVVRGIEDVVPRLDRTLHPVAVARWFELPNADLVDPTDEDRTLSPLDWLRSGGAPEAVAALAADL